MHTVIANDKNRNGEFVDSSKFTFDVGVSLVVSKKNFFCLLYAQDNRCCGARQYFKQSSASRIKENILMLK